MVHIFTSQRTGFGRRAAVEQRVKVGEAEQGGNEDVAPGYILARS